MTTDHRKSAAVRTASFEDQRRGRAGALVALLGSALGASLLSQASSRAAESVHGHSPSPDRAEDDRAIRTLIRTMQDAWNRGDFRGYMDGFQNPGVIFVSKGRIKTGWQDTLDHYIRDYGGPDRRGVLQFSEIEIAFLAPDAAQLVSHYRLQRPVDSQDGINTRLMRKIGGHWVIALNHVSAKENAPAGCAPPPQPEKG